MQITSFTRFWRIAAFILATFSISAGFAPDCVSQAGQRIFKHFSVTLPSGWDGDEQSGFISDNQDEYQLTLGRKDESGDSFVAQVSIFLLPNKPQADSKKAAEILAEAQADSSMPTQEGDFFVFTGEPRTRALKGKATTMVRTTPEAMLIIIAQDPENLGAAEIIKSLKAETDMARNILGR